MESPCRGKDAVERTSEAGWIYRIMSADRKDAAERISGAGWTYRAMPADRNAPREHSFLSGHYLLYQGYFPEQYCQNQRYYKDQDGNQRYRDKCR